VALADQRAHPAAADAGARIGSISPAAETPDPSIILAALDRVAEGMAVGHPAPLWATGEADATGADVTAAEAPAAEAPGAGRDAVTPDWSAAAAPTAAETAPAAASAAPAVPPARAAALSPTTILVAIVVAICVLIVVLAIV